MSPAMVSSGKLRYTSHVYSGGRIMSANTETIFSKIIRKEIPADIVYENEKVLAFKDINPQAPVHILIIPKKHLRDVSQAGTQDRELLGELFLAAGELSRQLELQEGGYRLVINNGSAAGQTVFHLHMHLLAGRNFGWPPG
jgi:histidine triad (HIT) family protein